MPVPDCFNFGDPCQNPSVEGGFDITTVHENLDWVTGSPEEFFAHMGWVGYVRMTAQPLTPANGLTLRVTSADINLSQEITMPDVIDGRIDRTVYQLGPKIVEGTLSMPVISDVDPSASGITNGCARVEDLRTGTATNLLDTIWCWATARSPHGRLQWSETKLDVRYANHSAFQFTKCIVNSLSMSVTQSDVVTFDIDVIGAARNRAPVPYETDGNDGLSIADMLSPARVSTWNDVTVSGVGGCDGEKLFSSAQVREFNFEINNNAERYYSLSGRLFPIDINVSKREITGSITLLGLQDRLRLRAEDQQKEFTRKDEIRMMFFVGDEAVSGSGDSSLGVSRDWFDISDEPQGILSGGVPFFWKKFTGVIFRIEEMALTNEVYETTVNWLALGNDQENYLAIVPGSSCQFPAWAESGLSS